LRLVTDLGKSNDTGRDEKSFHGPGSGEGGRGP
jgi:hypothetical protein